MSAFLIIQTAFAGDLILSLPLTQELRRLYPDSRIDLLCIPGTSPLLRNHPAIDEAIPYDKHGGSERLLSVARNLRSRRYDTVFSPHRSLRSALLAFATGARMRVAFDRAAGALLYSHRVRYDPDAHEVVRNLSLLGPLIGDIVTPRGPRLYPDEADFKEAHAILARFGEERPAACIAPGSVWATKRYPEEGFAAVARSLAADCNVILLGGKDDRALCGRIAAALPDDRAVNTSGEVSFLVSAALISIASVLISNDSAPVHIASAMGTPVVEIFGATVPGFGFTPFGVPHRIAELDALSCRPCAIHGGNACPIRTFACMRQLAPEGIVDAARELMNAREREMND
jgi:heptosyltransferase II